MNQYLLTMYQPDGAPPPTVDLERIMRDVGAIREEMQKANAWVFAGGLADASEATTVRPSGAEFMVIDGPYVEGKEHMGGLTIVRAPDLDAAVEWARQLAVATTLPVEVRLLRS